MAVLQPKTSSEPTRAARHLADFDCVRLLRDIPAGEGVMWMYEDRTASSVVAGSTGAIVHTLEDGEVFIVEISDPVPALIDVRRDQIERL